jgi:hypothetical protein
MSRTENTDDLSSPPPGHSLAPGTHPCHCVLWICAPLAAIVAATKACAAVDGVGLKPFTVRLLIVTVIHPAAENDARILKVPLTFVWA